MSEETALQLLSELQLINENLGVILENYNPLIITLGLSAMLLAFIFGALIIFILTRAIGKGI